MALFTSRTSNGTVRSARAKCVLAPSRHHIVACRRKQSTPFQSIGAAVTGLTESLTRSQTQVDLEQFYEIAAKELEVNAPRKGLYARAFAEAMGEENRAKANYIKLRVEQLEQALREQKEEEQRREHETRSSEIREQRQRLADSLKTDSECESCLTRHGYRVGLSLWQPGRWVVIGSPEGKRVFDGFESLREFTREVLLSDPSLDPGAAVGAVSTPVARTPASVNVATDDPPAGQPARIGRAPRVTDPAPAPARLAGQSRSNGGVPLPADVAVSAAGNASGRETLDPRFEKGKRWFANVMWTALILLAFKVLFTPGSPGWGAKLAEALIGVIGAGVFLGLLAFVLGWLAGGRKE